MVLPGLRGEAKGGDVTTKRWLLDLLDSEELRVRESIANGVGRDRLGFMTKTEYGDELSDIERARRLVEKGPDEP